MVNLAISDAVKLGSSTENGGGSGGIGGRGVERGGRMWISDNSNILLCQLNRLTDTMTYYHQCSKE
jgi:hypothetical protein